MKKCLSVTVILFFSGCLTVLGQYNALIINADQPQGKINKHIYGQFSEYLETGVYDGIWVCVNSELPNTEGYGTDVLNALQELQISNIRG